MKYFPRPCQSTLLRCGVKFCSKCGRILPLDSFSKHRGKSDGKQARCKECEAQHRKDNAEYYKQWRKDNKERIREYGKQWRKDNVEYSRQYRKDNKERIREYGKEYYKQYLQSPHGREIANASTARYRAKKKEVNETWDADDIKFCLKRADYKCEACGMTNEEHKERWNERLHMDHIKPLSEGHALTRDNCQVLCKTCNASKRTSQTSYRETPNKQHK